MLATIQLKTISVIILLLSISINAWGQNDERRTKYKARNDSLWEDRNHFLSHPYFLNNEIQDSSFQQVVGLWKCVKLISHRKEQNKTSYPLYSNALFLNNKVWNFDYPCSWHSPKYFENVHFRNDSIFISHKDRVYIKKKVLSFKGDTMIFTSSENWESSYYYVKQDYDETSLEILKNFGFNNDCISGVWELKEIGDGKSGGWVIKDGFLDHVPRILDFDSNDFRFEGKYLISNTNPEIRFEIIQFDRVLDKSEWWIWLKDTKKHFRIIHEYMFQPAEG